MPPEPALFVSQRIALEGEYTGGIEGPAVDRDGILYVASLKENGPTKRGTRTIGMLRPGAAKSEVFARLPDGSIGNGIRFDREGRMYVADHKGHNIFVFERGEKTAKVYVHAAFTQPNDLAMASDGTIYASDPNFAAGTGRIWRITRKADGTGQAAVMSASRTMGVTNGIDLSPDDSTLYVSESVTNKLWAFQVQGANLVAHRLVKEFETGHGKDLDGLRTDVDGKIFVARNGSRAVALVTPQGSSQDIPVSGANPSNLTFGGPDGRTVYVTQVDGGFIEAFRTDRPGREPFP
jgi:sugar lactone lactonase YvrE